MGRNNNSKKRKSNSKGYKFKKHSFQLKENQENEDTQYISQGEGINFEEEKERIKKQVELLKQGKKIII